MELSLIDAVSRCVPNKQLLEMIDAGADVNEKCGLRQSVLWYLMNNIKKYRSTIKLLLSAGAEVGCVNTIGFTLIYYISSNSGHFQSEKTLSELIDYDSDQIHVNKLGNYLYHAVQFTSYTGSEKAVKILSDAGAKIWLYLSKMRIVTATLYTENTIKMQIEAHF